MGASLTLAEHLSFETVPSDDPRTWQEVAASNRERIGSMEHEMDRVRDALHEFRGEAQAVRYLAEKVVDLASDVRTLATKVEQVSRRAVEKPTASALAVFGQYIGLVVAVVAILIAATK